MRIKPFLSVLLAVALCGGLLLAFPTQWMALVLALVGLLAVQWALLRRSATVVHSNATPRSMSLSMGPAHDDPGRARPGVEGVRAALNQELFSRFRAHLETAENQSVQPHEAPAALAHGPAAPAAPPPRPPEEVAAGMRALSSLVEAAQSGDRVAISSATPRPQPKPIPQAYTAAASRAPTRTKVQEPDDADLFTDLRVSPTAVPAARKMAGPAVMEPDRTGPQDRPPGSPQVSPQIRSRPKAADLEVLDEAGAVLKLAQEALRRGDLRGARAGLEQYLSEMANSSGDIAWQARWLEARLAILEGQSAAALGAFEAMLKSGYELKEGAIPSLMDELLGGAPQELGTNLRVALLLKVLAEFRQAHQRPEMDRLYVQLAQAQQNVGDERKLIQVLKNHLEIKKVMGDVPGQLDLIDQIGNRMFKLGDTAGAREFYALGLKLRAEQQAAKAPAEAAATEPAAPLAVPATGAKVGGGGTG